MPIPLGQEHAPGAPILKRRRLGESCQALVIDFQQRDKFKDDKPILKENGKYVQELVVHLLVIQTDMVASIGGVDTYPEPGTVVRLILGGGDFGAWIEAGRELRRVINVGDLVWRTTTHAIEYQQNRSEVATLRTQPEVDAYYQDQVRMGRTKLGFRGDMAIQDAPNDYYQWVQAAEAEYRKMTAIQAGPAEQQAPPAQQQPPAYAPAQQAPLAYTPPPAQQQAPPAAQPAYAPPPAQQQAPPAQQPPPDWVQPGAPAQQAPPQQQPPAQQPLQQQAPPPPPVAPPAQQAPAPQAPPPAGGQPQQAPPAVPASIYDR